MPPLVTSAAGHPGHRRGCSVQVRDVDSSSELSCSEKEAGELHPPVQCIGVIICHAEQTLPHQA